MPFSSLVSNASRFLSQSFPILCYSVLFVHVTPASPTGVRVSESRSRAWHRWRGVQVAASVSFLSWFKLASFGGGATHVVHGASWPRARRRVDWTYRVDLIERVDFTSARHSASIARSAVPDSFTLIREVRKVATPVRQRVAIVRYNSEITSPVQWRVKPGPPLHVPSGPTRQRLATSFSSSL